MRDFETGPAGAVDDEIHMYALRPRELGGFLDALEVEPDPASPLVGVRVTGELSDLAPALVADPAARWTVRTLAHPDLAVGLALGSGPEPGSTFWFYREARGADFAMHGLDGEGRHRIAGPVEPSVLIGMAAVPLDLYDPVEPRGIDLDLKAEALLALSALADFTRREALAALIDGNPLDEEAPGASAEELATLAIRYARGGGVAWSVGRMSLLAPVPPAWSASEMAAGLEALKQEGLVHEDEDGRAHPSPVLLEACLALGACTAVVALSTRHRDPETGTWAVEHRALLRAPGTMLGMEFSDLTRNGYAVHLTEVPPILAHHWILNGLRVWDDLRLLGEEGGTEAEEDEDPAWKEWASPPPPAPPEPAVQSFCTSCGTRLEAGLRFCTACGTPVEGRAPR